MNILFLHGWQSVPGGVKPTYLAQHGHEVINPKLPDEDFIEAVKIAQQEFDKHQPQVVVGSSRGGAVAMNIISGDARLVLLCPAWKKWGMARTVKPGTVILHSRADDVVPFADSEELVRNSRLPLSALIEVGNDHRLADPEPLEAMLRACEFPTFLSGPVFGMMTSDEQRPLEPDGGWLPGVLLLVHRRVSSRRKSTSPLTTPGRNALRPDRRTLPKGRRAV